MEITFDLTGVTIELDTALRQALRSPIHTDEFVINGAKNTLKGLTITNVGDGKALGGAVLGVTGMGNTLRDCTIRVQGSAPYGYGDLFGKGGFKHSAVHITGSGSRFIGCKVFTKAFGHAFYLQENCNDVAFENCHAEGVMRRTDDMLAETSGNIIVARFSDLVAESKIPALDLASNYDELGKFASERLHDDFEAYGLDVTNLLVENVSLPPEVEAALDKRTSMGVIGNLQQYTQFQAANAMEAAAKNPGGDASGGMGMGMGFAMANQMANSFGQQQPQGAPAGPPPIPGQTSYFVAVNGQQTGPFAVALLKQQAQQGALCTSRHTLNRGWQPLSSY